MALEDTNAGQANENWKSDRFINIAIPTEGGAPIRLVSAGLKLNDPNHKQLIEWLDKDPEKNLKTLMGQLVADYRPAEKTVRSFGFMGS